MNKRFFSLLAAFALCLTLIPTTAFADDEKRGEDVSPCSCETACTADNMNKKCPVCGAENAIPQNCGQYIPVEDRTGENGSTERADDPNGPIELSAADQVQAMINGLPNAEEITEDNAEEVNGIYMPCTVHGRFLLAFFPAYPIPLSLHLDAAAKVWYHRFAFREDYSDRRRTRFILPF